MIAFCPSSVNIFSSVTSGSIVMKLHRKHPLNVLSRIPSNFWDPCRITVSEKTQNNILLLNWLADFQIILQKCSLGDPLSDSFKLCDGQKHGRQGAGLLCLIWLKWKLKKNGRNGPSLTHYQIPSSHVDG